MIEYVPIEVVIVGVGVIGTLSAYAWNGQSARIKKVERVQATRPCNQICAHIEAIKVDLEWIKRTLNKN